MPVSVEEKKYYVYEVIVDGDVRYVGKGRGRRAARHVGIAAAVTRNDKHRYARSRFYKALGAAIEAGQSVEIQYAGTGLSSEQAFRQEMDRIATYGLENLWNSTPGGEGISSQVAQSIALERWSDPQKRKQQSIRLKDAYADPSIRERHKTALRRDLSSDDRLVRSNNAKLRWARPGERDRQSIAAKALQAARSAKRKANLYCAFLSFGC